MLLDSHQPPKAKQKRNALVGFVAIVANAGLATPLAAKPAETVIHAFTGDIYGSAPIMGTLVASPTGAVYGAASGISGGVKQSHGLIFQLTPPVAKGDTWTYSTIYKFKDQGDGYYPVGGLTLDPPGNLYGTTQAGVVFEISPPATEGASWTEQTLINLNAATPFALIGSPLLGAHGELYVVIFQDDEYPNGAVFELAPPVSGTGSWTYTTLYVFQNTGDGSGPAAGLIRDSAGALFGTTSGGGNSGNVFELIPPTQGGTAWTENVLYAFKGGRLDGKTPMSTLLFDPSGNLYGTTEYGGRNNDGIIFELKPPMGGNTAWRESIIHQFSPSDGANPEGGLIRSTSGEMYGNTTVGPSGGYGTVFKITPPSGTSSIWREKILWSFFITDGFLPEGDLLRVPGGGLLGTTESGGLQNCGGGYCGTVFEVIP